jgi:hypothetical protein
MSRGGCTATHLSPQGNKSRENPPMKRVTQQTLVAPTALLLVPLVAMYAED